MSILLFLFGSFHPTVKLTGGVFVVPSNSLGSGVYFTTADGILGLFGLTVTV
jgi:hypothetical protein